MVSPTFAVNSRGSSNCDVAATPSCWVRKGSHTGAKRNRALSISRRHADSGKTPKTRPASMRHLMA